MDTKKILPAILVLAVILIAGFLAFQSYQKVSKPLPKPAQTAIPTPIPSPISKPAPVQITTVRGTITAISGNNLTINISGNLGSYSIAGTKDFQKLTSGTVESGDALTVPSSASELKVGQEVLLIVPINSTSARSVYIVK